MKRINIIAGILIVVSLLIFSVLGEGDTPNLVVGLFAFGMLLTIFNYSNLFYPLYTSDKRFKIGNEKPMSEDRYRFVAVTSFLGFMWFFMLLSLIVE